MKRWRGIAAALWLACAAAWGGGQPLPGVSLRGDLQQGALVFGRAAPGSLVQFNGRSLRLSAAGDFVFGLDRDAPAFCELGVRSPGKAAVSRRLPVRRGHWRIQRLNGLPPDLVNPPPAVERRIADEARLIAAARGRDSDLDDFALPFAWPAQGRVSGVFGSQRILNGVPKRPHYGTDIAVPVGTAVRAPAGGIVSLAQTDLYFTGGTLIIDHGHGLSSVLVHLSRLLVKPGARVARGQVVALSGMTGRATGPHLHWGLFWFDAHVDGQRLLPPR